MTKAKKNAIGIRHWLAKVVFVLPVALQLAAFAPAIAEAPSRAMLRNDTLPVPSLSRAKVEQVMAGLKLAARTEPANVPAAEPAAAPAAEPAAASDAVSAGSQAAAQASEDIAPVEAAPSADARKIAAAQGETAAGSDEAGASVPAPADAGPQTLGSEPLQAGEPAEAGEGKFGKPAELALNLNFGPGSVFYDGKTPAPRLLDGVLVIDNDEAEEVETTIAYEDLALDESKTKARVGAKFPVVVVSEITSKTAKVGDPLHARLKYDLKIGDRVVARKGSLVLGHINYALKARTILHSLVSPERWYRNSGCLGIAFDEVINEKNEHIPLVAQPARKSRIVKNKYEGRVLGVNHAGQVVGPWSQQLRYKAIRVGLNFALAPAGVFSFGAMPVALGVIGAVNPSFAFSKPVGLNVRHRRIKGFAWGFLSGIPGSWLIEDTVVKGQEAIIKPGDEFLAEIKQEFTGEPETEASLMPNASTKVRGQVVDEGKAKIKGRRPAAAK